jgi:hypothetical protein
LTHICVVQPVIASAEVAIRDEIETVGKLAVVASACPYYKSVSIFWYKIKLTASQIQWHLD